MSTYADYEDAIATQLGTLANVDIIVLPDNEADYNLPYSKSKITVAYVGSRFGMIKQLVGVSQDEMQLYEIVIQSRSTRGEIGAYELLDYCKKKLLGFAPLSSKKMYVESSADEMIRLMKREKGIFTYSFQVVVETVFVQQLNEPEFDGPPLVKAEPLVVNIGGESNVGIGYTDRIGESKIGELP